MSPGRFSTPPLAPEDDWFAEADEPASGGRGEPRVPVGSTVEPDRSSRESRRVQWPEGERDRRILVAAIAGALVLLVGGLLVARAFTGADGGDETATQTLPTTTSDSTATTPTATTPTATTPTATTPTTTAPTGTTSLPTTLPESLRSGDESEAVRQVQAALVALGYATGGVDGKYGPTTEQAVREFQTDSGLEDDGIVGAETLDALAAALNEQ